MSAAETFEATAELATLLDRIEHGEAVTITRNGRPVAELIPPRVARVAAALAEAAALRARIAAYSGPVTWEEIKQDRDFGRR